LVEYAHNVEWVSDIDAHANIGLNGDGLVLRAPRMYALDFNDRDSPANLNVLIRVCLFEGSHLFCGKVAKNRRV
jgi:hypothetical protein